MFKFLKELLKTAVVRGVIKAAAKGLSRLFTRNATPAARAYAENVAEEATDAIPEVIGKLDEIQNAYKNGTVGLNPETAQQAGYLFGLPMRAYQHYQRYQYLNHTASPVAEMDSGEEFVLLSSMKSGAPAPARAC